jgi:ubiquinone/menaquinone biosynthesis C-methylase UbiE
MIADDPLKAAVQRHWEEEVCGVRYSANVERRAFFEELARERYRLEPYILPFADFPSAKNDEILEIGVGAGADFANWCRFAKHATGIDLTHSAIDLTRERLQVMEVPQSRYSLRQTDAERLPFADGSFDGVYSWGVLHHTPDTAAAFREVNRVLRPGGWLRAMIYHVPSWTGFLLQARYGWLRGRFLSQKQALYNHLESPGTKAYRIEEAKDLLRSVGFSDVRASTRLNPSDLLLIKPRQKYDGLLYRAVWRLYPRAIVRWLGDRLGLYLLLEARKG